MLMPIPLLWSKAEKHIMECICRVKQRKGYLAEDMRYKIQDTRYSLNGTFPKLQFVFHVKKFEYLVSRILYLISTKAPHS